MRVADRVQAPLSPAPDPQQHTRRVLAGLGFYVMVTGAASPVVATLADPGGPDWDLAGLLAALAVTVAVAVMLAARKPPLPVWGRVTLVAAAAAVSWLCLPGVGPLAALPVVLLALGVLGLTQHLVAALVIGALGVLFPRLLLSAGCTSPPTARRRAQPERQPSHSIRPSPRVPLIDHGQQLGHLKHGA